jgi:glycosyltransferase involved in cell wall biosynthesis
MKISIIIPTHNRAESLNNTIQSIIKGGNNIEYELIIVDNNSTDNTKQTVRSYPNSIYVFEKSTSFTKARNTGFEKANGDILLYLDDDVELIPGSLYKINEIFETYLDCGVIAGKIFPKFLSSPPNWVINCQKSFNGFSLFNEQTYSFLTKDFQEVPSAAGPMMAIRKTAYIHSGGFPPDTIGVESNRMGKTFNKLYIGIGDSGLCIKIRKLGFKVYYSSEISCYHLVPSIRFTVGFWRSRMIGEGYCNAISDRMLFKYNPLKLFLKRLLFSIKFLNYEKKLISKIQFNEKYNITFLGVFPEELWVRFYKGYLDMDWVLRKYPGFSNFLWKIGFNGVSDEQYLSVLEKFPEEYRALISNDYVYDEEPLTNFHLYESKIKNAGYYNPYRRTALFMSKLLGVLKI